jgi:hypothetical protein
MTGTFDPNAMFGGYALVRADASGFKVGDRVTVKEGSFSSPANKRKEGKTGTITKVYTFDETYEVDNGIGRIAPEFLKKA